MSANAFSRLLRNFTNELYKETIQIARITITAIKMITVIVFIFLGYGCKHTN